MDLFLKTIMKYRKMISATETTSLSYYIILSVVPMLSLLIILFSYLNLDITVMTEFLLRYFSDDLTLFLVDYLSQRSASYFSVVAIMMCLVVASRGVYRLKQVTNRLYGVPAERLSFVRSRLYAVLNTITFLLFTVILVIILGILPGLTIILEWFEPTFLGKYLLAYIVIFILLLIINLIVPSVWPGLKAASIGAAVASLGTIILMIFMRFFRNAAAYDALYGPLASIAAALILLNWMSNVIYFGICMSSVIYREDLQKGGRS